MSNKLSVSNCPDCDSKDIIKTNKKPYKEHVYKCRVCKTSWDKDTRYCNRCKDVAMYCKCYEDIENFIDN